MFETERLYIRRAEPNGADIDLFYRLWTDPKVMRNVGFPSGLRITREEILRMLESQSEGALDVRLLATVKESGELEGRTIGECKLGKPDKDGVSTTDVKLLPEFQGRGYGTEIKRGLVAYLFTHTEAQVIRATPNRRNIASQKMQEAVGARRVGEGVFVAPESMREYATDVPHFVYEITREEWKRQNV